MNCIESSALRRERFVRQVQACVALTSVASHLPVATTWRSGMQEFILNYSLARPLSCSGAATNGQCSSAAASHTVAQQIVFTYRYWLSRRAMLEAYVSRIHSSSFGTYDYGTNPAITSVSSRAPEASPVCAGFGIRQ